MLRVARLARQPGFRRGFCVVMKKDVTPSTTTPDAALSKAVTEKASDAAAPSVATKSSDASSGGGGGGDGGGSPPVTSSTGDSADRSSFDGRDIAFKVRLWWVVDGGAPPRDGCWRRCRRWKISPVISASWFSCL